MNRFRSPRESTTGPRPGASPALHLALQRFREVPPLREVLRRHGAGSASVAAVGTPGSLSLFFILLLVLAAGPGPSISYFSDVREVRIPQTGVQNYFVVDEEIWRHARPDLADLRIYDGETQVQFALSEQRSGASIQESAARILNLGSVRGSTEFDLDMNGVGEYDRLRLVLDAKDFVVTASVAGSNELGQKSTTQLPPSTLYDFSREQLGANFVLKLPRSSFRYLHVRLSAGVTPEQVKDAFVYKLEETKAVWTSIGSCGTPVQDARTTVIVCKSPPHVPVDRVRLQVDPKQVNFRRAVRVTDEAGHECGTGEIRRVRIGRTGATVVSEELDVSLGGEPSGLFKITLDNADNPPLLIATVQLLSLERRVYFGPQDKATLKLYYGDSKLDFPVYDYARFFKADPAAVQAQLGPASHNAAYRGRPDDRPWSERHSAVLWLAMLVAALMLAVLAVRGLRAQVRP